ncbi:DUF47 family protein [Roseateles sp. DB2]|uniref:DUF47 family protein n=1 Tax=Roseateles sp. DB2 TaxID=3453717 RepID=UPI003EE924D3
MIKQEAVAALGQDALVRPARVREALKANDRLKLALTVIQASAAQAAAPERPAVDLAHEIAAAGIHERDEVRWWRELPARAQASEHGLLLPDLDRLARHLGTDLATMARPVLDDSAADAPWAARVAHWQDHLQHLPTQPLDKAALADLTRGHRDEGDSLHLLVMDLHKALNRLAAQLHGEDVDGAHAWGLAPSDSPEGAVDRSRLSAFMRGLARTRHLKGTHPGLDTSATRDGERLLIQNDIGTNDAHVLVLQVQGLALSLTYSDLHRTRFAFFQQLLAEAGAAWSEVASRTQAGLNQGEAYHVGTARWEAADEPALQQALEAVGARIVFLIDWNRARKRLQNFVGKEDAIAVLATAAHRECGHMAWLVAGGERLVWDAMAAQGEGVFRLGDRLEDVLGAPAARDWLVTLLELAATGVGRGQPAAWVADEARLLLARTLRHHAGGGGFGSPLQEHASWCHALAQGLRDALAHGAARHPHAAKALATRAKHWERRADELVEQARHRAERHPATASGDAELLHAADDIADALEEACFALSLAAEARPDGWGPRTTAALQSLADAVLSAVQEHVKAVTIVGQDSASAADETLDALWHVVQAERQCDELLRAARRALAHEAKDAVAWATGNELASALEKASDHLLAVGHALRRRTLAARPE